MATTKKATTTVKETAAKVETKAAETTAVAKEAVEKAATTAKKTATKTAATAKKTAAKTATAAKTTAKKTVAKAAAKTSTVKSVVTVQYQNNEVDLAKVEENVKAAYVAEGHTAASIKKVEIYVKPEEYSAYYVINGKSSGRVDLF